MPILAATEETIERAAEALTRGKLVAFPTETVYGLGADALNEQAVQRVFTLKGRPTDHPLIVHLPWHLNPDRAAVIALLSHWADPVPEGAVTLAHAFWPGPLTLVLPRAAGVPDGVTGGLETVGLRVPDNPLALELLANLRGLRGEPAGIAAPSANRFGGVSPTLARHVQEEFSSALRLLGSTADTAAPLEDEAGVILDSGPAKVGIESTIVDLTSGFPRILRPGAISIEEIRSTLGTGDSCEQVGVCVGAAPRVPGMLDSHYAPRARVTPVEHAALAAAIEQRAINWARARLAVVAPRLALAEIESAVTVTRFPLGDSLAQQAQGLYAAMRAADATAVEELLIMLPPAEGIGIAIRDRIFRAAGMRPTG